MEREARTREGLEGRATTRAGRKRGVREQKVGEDDNELGVKGERKKAQGSKIRIERKLCDPNMPPPPLPFVSSPFVP